MGGDEPELTLQGGPPTLKNCADCGVGFSCGAPAAGCWCEDVQVAAEVLVALQARYADCLCRRCLTAVAAAAALAPRALHSDSEASFTGCDNPPQHLL
jgi:hypothetical protein